MGFRIRKSINLGGGFRINLSKNGVGYSWGMKGIRYTKTVRGANRSTYSIPGTGFSYVQETGYKEGEIGENVNDSREVGVDDSISTEDVDIEKYQSVKYEHLLASIRKVQKWNLISTVLICTFLLSMMPVFVITGIIGIALKFYVHVRMPIILEYFFDEVTQTNYGNLCALWIRLNLNNRFWQVISQSNLRQRVSGGASLGIKRIPVKVINKLPFFIKANIEVFGVRLRRQKVYFLPDKILVVSTMKVGAIDYSDIQMHLDTIQFIETDSVPKDANILGYTWLKVNRDGTPDKRFKGNIQVPICEYGEIKMSSGNVFRIEFMYSNSDLIQDIKNYVNKVFK